MGKCVICGKPTREEWHKYCNEHYKPESSSQSKRHIGLPQSYLAEGYFNEHGHLRGELITSHAKEIAQTLTQTKVKMTAAALRKFFGKVRAIQRSLQSRHTKSSQTMERDFEAVIPDILALEPYVNNAVTREVVPDLFKTFIERNVKLAVKKEKSFSEGFVKHFEYVVAFFPRSK